MKTVCDMTESAGFHYIKKSVDFHIVKDNI